MSEKKTFAVYKRIVDVGTERVVDAVEATSERDAVVQYTGDHMVGCAGAIRFMDTYFTAYRGNANGVFYFAGEVR